MMLDNLRPWKQGKAHILRGIPINMLNSRWLNGANKLIKNIQYRLFVTDVMHGQRSSLKNKLEI